MNFEELRSNHREQILKVAEELGITNVRVFGSVVRGDAGEGSDIDFLVTLPKGIGWDFADFVCSVEGMTGMPVQLVSDRSINPLIRDRIMNEAKPL